MWGEYQGRKGNFTNEEGGRIKTLIHLAYGVKTGGEATFWVG